jgi:phage-related protein/uncharacterized protein YoxC
MASNIGAKIELQGEAQFKKAVTEINTNLRTLGTEMTKVKSEFDKNDKSIEFYTKKNQVLNKQIDEQKNKIEALEKGLKVSAEKYGENATQTQKWQQDLNRATADLNKMEREVKNNNKAIEDANDPTKELSKEIDNMGKNADGAGGKLEKLGGALKTSAVAMGAVAVAAGAAAIKLGKEVISSFGSYEQLVGGVDTLFKDSSQLLQDYAANAHKTAGLSANDYMETVTSFSASLIQSLGGDTEKAVEYADMAITDMSDNANKMGTDMASIQNAYQGFAKQNYAMLDNLKLGYGGTKTEMERLLADATAISGIEYDVSSYADVVSALHIIQENMGIAGATALEAEETIEGSLNAFKASFENLITGFGNADADVGKLTENLITSFDTVLENIMPVIENIISAFPQIFSAVIPAIGDLLPELLDAATGLFSQVLDTLIKLLPSLIPVAVNAVKTITNTLINNIPLLIDSAITLMLSLTDGLIDALPILIPAAIAIIIALASGLIDALPKLINRLPEIINAIVKGLVDGIPKILQFIPQLYTSLADIVTKTNWMQMGIDIVTGLWNGINSLADWIREKVTGFVKGIGDTIKNFFGIESPSTLMAEYGKYIDEGLAQGIENNANKPLNAMSAIASSISDTVTGSISELDRLARRIANFDAQDDDTRRERNNKAKKKNDDIYKANKDAINRISRDLVVDTSVATEMFKKMKGYAVGTPFVTEDQVALIHKGEAIIPAQYNPYNQNSELKGGGDTFHVTIDAKNIKDFTDVVRVFTGIKQTARQGV